MIRARARTVWLLVAALAAAPSARAADSYWETDFGVVHLEENGGEVLGSYLCCAGGVLFGKRQPDGTYDLRWTDPLNGSGWALLRTDGGELRGTWGIGSDAGQQLRGRWNGSPLRPRPIVGGSGWSVTGTSEDTVTEGAAWMRIEGGRVTGLIAATVRLAKSSLGAPPLDVFNDLQGTVSDSGMDLVWSNPLQGSRGTMRLRRQGKCWAGTWTGSDAATGNLRLCPQDLEPRHFDLAAAATRETARLEARWLVDQGIRRFRAGDYGGVLGLADRAIGRLRADTSGPADLLASAYMSKAQALRRLDRHEEADAALRAVIALGDRIEPGLLELALGAMEGG